MMPEGWRRTKLGKHIAFRSGFPFKSERFSAMSEGRWPLVRIRDLVSQIPETFTDEYVPTAEVRAGQILIGMDGDFLAVRWKGEPALLNQRVCQIFSANSVELDDGFLFHSLQPILATIHSQTSATTVKHLSTKNLQVIEAILPPLPEQRAIAEILDSVDATISATEATLAQTRRVKQALLQQLLTKGIDENGRPHTKFKMTEIGEIPEAWEVVKLDDVAKRGSGHTPNKKHPEYWDGGIKWVSLSDSYKLDKVYIFNTEKKISQSGIENSSAVVHPAGTVVMARDAGIGKCAVLNDEMAVSQHFMAWRCTNKLNAIFLYYQLLNRRSEFESVASGTTIKTIGLPYFKALLIALPPISEQEEISQALLHVDSLDEKFEGELWKQKSLKRALMRDLLTGKVRVKDVKL